MRTTPNRVRPTFIFSILIIISSLFALQSFKIPGGEKVVVAKAPLEIASVSVQNPRCFGYTNGRITLTAAGGTAPYTYQWSPSGGTGAVANSLSAGNYTCTVKDALGEEVTSSVITLTEPPKLTISKSIEQNVTCEDVDNGAVAINPATGGTAPYRYSWSEAKTGLFVQDVTAINNIGEGDYVARVIDAPGCSDTLLFVIKKILQDVEAAAPVGNNTNFETGCNEPIAALESSGPNPVTGPITANLFLRDEVQLDGASVYLRRSYEITPTIDPTTATARITLYFLQEDFDDFNSNPASTYKLPIDPSNASGKANFRIVKFSGASFNGTGLPSDYAASPTIINPDDNDIVWNSTDTRWEISFDVSGFSGFFVEAVDAVTPLRFISFTGSLRNDQALLEWKTDNEINTSSFDIERSTDGRNFSKIGAASSNNSPGIQRYHFIDATVPKQNISRIFYRIKQKDIDGAFAYSAILPLSIQSSMSYMSISPNPTNSSRAVLSIGLLRSENIELTVLNANGLIMQRSKYDLSTGNSVIPIDISRLNKGLYFVRVKGNITNKTLKLIKQ